MEKKHSFSLVLLFLSLKNNNQIFSSLDNTNMQLSIIQSKRNNSNTSSSWIVTEETAEQKKQRIIYMLQAVDDMIQKLYSDCKPLPENINNFLKNNNFIQRDIDEINDYLLKSESKTLNDKILEQISFKEFTQKPNFSSEAVLAITTNNQLSSMSPIQQSSTDNLFSNMYQFLQKQAQFQQNFRLQHPNISKPAISSSTNNQICTLIPLVITTSYPSQTAQTNSSNNQLDSNKSLQDQEKELIIHSKINNELLPLLKKHFIQKAADDVNQQKKPRYHIHIAEFELRGEKNFTLLPIGKNINDFIQIEDYRSQIAKDVIRKKLFRDNGSFKRIYFKAFKEYQKELITNNNV